MTAQGSNFTFAHELQFETVIVPPERENSDVSFYVGSAAAGYLDEIGETPDTALRVLTADDSAYYNNDVTFDVSYATNTIGSRQEPSGRRCLTCRYCRLYRFEDCGQGCGGVSDEFSKWEPERSRGLRVTDHVIPARQNPAVSIPNMTAEEAEALKAQFDKLPKPEEQTGDALERLANYGG